MNDKQELKEATISIPISDTEHWGDMATISVGKPSRWARFWNFILRRKEPEVECNTWTIEPPTDEYFPLEFEDQLDIIRFGPTFELPKPPFPEDRFCREGKQKQEDKE